MLKRILIIFVLFFTCLSKAQTVFLPNIGTQWHYSFSNFSNGSITNTKIEYVRDSIDVFNNDTIKVLSTGNKFFSHCNFLGNYTFIKHKHDSIWFYNSVSNNTWQLLFNFSALPTQSWTYQAFSSGYLNTYTVIVNSITALTMNSQNLKALNVTSKVGPYTYTNTICERIGGMDFLFNTLFYNPNVTCDADDLQKFLCYEDSTFGVKQFTSYPCDYHVGLKEQQVNKNQLALYPNPANESITIDFIEINNNGSYKIEIVNSLGQVVKEVFRQAQQPKEKSFCIDTKDLPNGVYFLQLFDSAQSDSMQSLSKRFVIAR